MLARFWAWIKGLFQAPTPIVPPDPQPASKPAVDLRALHYFQHAKMRFEQRYSWRLEQAQWRRWNEMILARHPLMLDLGPRPKKGHFWQISHGRRKFYVVVHHQMIITVLPEEAGRFDAKVEHHRAQKRDQIKARLKPAYIAPLKTGKTKSRQVGRGVLDKKQPKKKPQKATRVH